MSGEVDSNLAEDADDLLVAEYLVTPVVFDKSLIFDMSDRWCGNSTSGGEATYWINGKGSPSVRTELNRGTKVWVYQNGAGELVGFGSLGLTKWNIGGKETDVQFIPMLAVFEEHQGKPVNGTGYCYQIVDHLIDEAESRSDRYPLLGLSVYSDNEEAIHIYTKSGFVRAEEIEGYNRMVMTVRG